MPPPKEADSHRSIPSLDGLRAVSICLVLLGHAYFTANYPHNAVTKYLSTFPVFGVRIFFAISGFLITTLLMKERARTGKIDLKGFYLRRTLRIFPACYCYILAMAVIARPKDLIYAFTYTFCYVAEPHPWVLSHLWSLSVEEQFYVLWPLVVVLFFSRARQLGLLSLALAPLARLFFSHFSPDSDKYFPCIADNLMMGCLLALYYKEFRAHLLWMKSIFFLIPLFFFTLLCIRISWHPWYDIYLGGLIPLLIVFFLFALIERRDWIFNNRFVKAIGVMSYSIYLWQQPFMNEHLVRWWTTFPVNIILTLMIAAASYYLVELPFLNLYRSRSERVSREVFLP